MFHPLVSARALCVLACACACSPLLAGPVNINTADAPTLARELKGIGLKRAEAIVEYRSKNGPFRSPDELALVKGIGPQAIARNRADIRLDAGKPAAKPGAAPGVGAVTPAAATSSTKAPPPRAR